MAMFLLLGLLVISMMASADPSCPETMTDVITGNLLVNGSLLGDDGVVYPPEDFEVTVNNTYQTCVCKHRPCITKCCPHQHIYRRDNPRVMTKCTPSPEDTEFYDQYPQFHVLVGLKCKHKYLLEKDEKFTVFGNGTMKAVMYDGSTVFSPLADYCIETYDMVISTDLVAYRCFPGIDQSSQASFLMMSTSMIISSLFLLATIWCG